MAKKYYVVWQGREAGVFTDWDTCKTHVQGFPGARYKSFPTREQAETAFSAGTPTKTSTSGAKSRPKKPTRANPTTGRGPSTHTAAEVSAIQATTKIFTDGGCEPNPGEAGSGLAIYRNEVISELWYGLYTEQGTNNTAELGALQQALYIAKQEVSGGNSTAVFCDSKYSIQCVTQWASSWEKNGWKKKGGEIKNLDLIKEMYALYQSLNNSVDVLHVNGHVGIEGNELADRMSILAIEKRETEFQLYEEDIDIPGILALRSG